MTQAKEPSGDDLQRIIEHLKDEEAKAQESTLSSMESLQLWILGHPGLQQPGIYDLLNSYGPALLQVIRRMMGL